MAAVTSVAAKRTTRETLINSRAGPAPLDPRVRLSSRGSRRAWLVARRDRIVTARGKKSPISSALLAKIALRFRSFQSDLSNYPDRAFVSFDSRLVRLTRDKRDRYRVLCEILSTRYWCAWKREFRSAPRRRRYALPILRNFIELLARSARTGLSSCRSFSDTEAGKIENLFFLDERYR